ncbi:hypothetical protein GLYMA_09G082800v4 [Glycine max]|uniref:Uncharacterized protein n=1 Tax=Glycine max TaxID=3847 RepID=A0A0R0I5M7_SOYBN|nr:hypothetical protein JHK87_024369 [Glycine soja]KRH37697.1 hypothetical protein GLYMA_09G082800v4 [Glycine max]
MTTISYLRSSPRQEVKFFGVSEPSPTYPKAGAFLLGQKVKFFGVPEPSPTYPKAKAFLLGLAVLCLIWPKNYLWVFSLLSFYVFFFHLVYLMVAEYCSSFARQKLQFFCVFCLCFVL